MVYVLGALLLVVGGVVNDETDRLWSEALFALACFRCKHSILKVTDMTIYQRTKVPPHRYLEYTNIDIYTIQIASNCVRGNSYY